MKTKVTKSEQVEMNYLVSFFTDLKNTFIKGRFYTNETFQNYRRSQELGIDLVELGIYPEGFDPNEVISQDFTEEDRLFELEFNTLE